MQVQTQYPHTVKDIVEHETCAWLAHLSGHVPKLLACMACTGSWESGISWISLGRNKRLVMGHLGHSIQWRGEGRTLGRQDMSCQELSRWMATVISWTTEFCFFFYSSHPHTQPHIHKLNTSGHIEVCTQVTMECKSDDQHILYFFDQTPRLLPFSLHIWCDYYWRVAFIFWKARRHWQQAKVRTSNIVTTLKCCQ